jgi:hypothetical protein
MSTLSQKISGHQEVQLAFKSISVRLKVTPQEHGMDFHTIENEECYEKLSCKGL